MKPARRTTQTLRPCSEDSVQITIAALWGRFKRGLGKVHLPVLRSRCLWNLGSCTVCVYFGNLLSMFLQAGFQPRSNASVASRGFWAVKDAWQIKNPMCSCVVDAHTEFGHLEECSRAYRGACTVSLKVPLSPTTVARRANRTREFYTSGEKQDTSQVQLHCLISVFAHRPRKNPDWNSSLSGMVYTGLSFIFRQTGC